MTNIQIRDEISEEKNHLYLLFLKISILIIFNCLWFWMGLCTATLYPWKLEDNRSLGAGVAGSFEPQMWMLETDQVLCQSSEYL